MRNVNWVIIAKVILQNRQQAYFIGASIRRKRIWKFGGMRKVTVVLLYFRHTITWNPYWVWNLTSSIHKKKMENISGRLFHSLKLNDKFSEFERLFIEQHQPYNTLHNGIWPRRALILRYVHWKKLKYGNEHFFKV